MSKQKKIVMTESDLKLYREKIIRSCKIKYKSRKETISFNKSLRILNSLLPITILIGVVAAIIYLYMNGWNSFFQLILTGIIWITLISTFISAIGRKNAQ